MKDEKQYEWVDVTSECEGWIEDSLMQPGYYGVSITNPDGGCSEPFNINSGLGVSGRTCGQARIVPSPDGIRFRIERRVEKAPFVFWYTAENVRNLDCKHLSNESVLHHCVLKWDEVVAAQEAGVNNISANTDTCPCCVKFGFVMGNGRGCDTCPLYDAGCCGEFYDGYKRNRTAATAAAVRDYIQAKLDSIREQKPWTPKQGDPVSAYGQAWCVVGQNTGGSYLLFSAEGRGWHSGLGSNLEWGAPVPGCTNHHRWSDASDLTLIKDDK